ncbi:MAG: WD40/YVTN/BNR-like repeat-containing protein [Candidatus Rokuibacteriota bacterium]
MSGFAVHPSNPKVMYVAMRDGVFRSDNAGAAWTRAATGPKNVAAVAINPKMPSEVYAATMDGKIFRSTDGGMRWDEVR